MATESPLRRSRSILVIIVGLLSFGLVALASLFIYSGQKQQLIDTKQQEMTVEAELIGSFLRDYLLRHDYSEARRLLKDWPETHVEVKRLRAVLDNGRDLFAFAHPTDAPIMEIESKISYGDRLLKVYLGHSVAGVNQSLDRLAAELLIFSLLVILFTGLLLWYVLFRWAIRPMEREIAHRTDQLRQSEERFRRLAENARDMIYRMSLPDGRYEYVSPASRELMGYEPQEFYDEPLLISKVIHPQWLGYLKREWENLLRGEMPGSYEYQVVHKNGDVRWLHQRNSLIRDERQQPIAIEGIVTDISERKQLEQGLSRYKQIIESTNEGIFVISPEGELLDANEAFSRITGYRPEELVARGDNFFKAAEQQDPAFYRAMRQQLDSSGGWSGELWDRRKNGTAYPKWLAMSAIRDESGETASYVGIFTDITERKRAEQELIQYRGHLEELVEERTAEMRAARDEAEDASRAKSDFLSSMSHELRTPMNAILGFAQLLEMDMDQCKDPQQAESVREIIAAGAHLLELIGDLLELTKIEAGKVQINRANVEVQTVLRECVSLLTTSVREAELEMALDETCAGPHFVRADPVRLKQVLLNLLSNAIKYNHRGGQVQLACAPVDGSRLRLSVQDTGKGIPVEAQSRLFVPFERLGAERSAIRGTGIGLVISKNLIELMDGRIGFESVEGVGSTFWIELPLAAAEPSQSGTEFSVEGGCCGLESCCCRVLYIEDNPSNTKLVRQILQQLGSVELLTAHTGPLGLQMALDHPCELILIDINLPGMSGLEVVRQLRQNERYQQSPMVALSADAMQEDIDRALAAGFSHYVTKPLDVPAFKKLVTELLPQS